MELLDFLRSAWNVCTRCELHRTRKRVVFGSGAATARLVIIGEAPGADEDEQGVPFVGRAGALLDAAIREAGLIRRAIFITNSLSCRPPSNRDPRPEEQEACWNRLVNTIDIIRPGCLLLIGKPAAQRVLGRDVGILKEKGSGGLVSIGDRSINYVLALHPSYIQRQDFARRAALRSELAGHIKRAWDVAKGWSEEDEIPF